jgi:hypothetical protein
LARSRKPKSTSKKRSERQRAKDRYAHARDDAQRLGLIETKPEEALVNEKVDPVTQGSQPLPGIIGQAIRKGWGVPEEIKIATVDELHGIVISTDESIFPHVKVMAARALQQGDQIQWERDNPELAGKIKGGVKVNVSNEINNQISLLDIARQRLAEPDPETAARKEIVSDRSRKESDDAQQGRVGAEGEPDAKASGEDMAGAEAGDQGH